MKSGGDKRGEGANEDFEFQHASLQHLVLELLLNMVVEMLLNLGFVQNEWHILTTCNCKACVFQVILLITT